MNECFRLVLIVIAALVGIIIVSAIIWKVICVFRCRKFRPSCHSQEQVERVNRELESLGFLFDARQEIFYSRHDAWQRRFGYRKLFDEMAPSLSMIIDSEPVTFEYNGRKWLLELWKGQYGITVGAEIGIYVSDDGTHYESVDEQEELPMAFLLYQGEDVIMRRQDRHWWLTGFRVGVYAQPSDLLMFVEIQFPNSEMCLAALNGFRQLGYGRENMAVMRNTIRLRFDKPYSKQPRKKFCFLARIRMKINKINCRIFNRCTRKYPCMLDKIEYIKFRAPRLYRLVIKLFRLL